MDEKMPFFFLAGCTKCATTWLWKCFVEHPEILVPDKIDRINFFNIHYDKGYDWYRSFFSYQPGNKVILDPTPEYIKDPLAPLRIHSFRPDARILFVLRNPIDRAISLWWHHKRKGRINYKFEDVLLRGGVGSFALYDEWIISGFYLHWIKKFTDLFPKERIKIMLFEDLEVNPSNYLGEVLEFLGVNEEFVPSVIKTKVNDGGEYGKTYHLGSRLKEKVFPRSAASQLVVSDDLRSQLATIFFPHNIELGEYIGRDLSHWK